MEFEIAGRIFTGTFSANSAIWEPTARAWPSLRNVTAGCSVSAARVPLAALTLRVTCGGFSSGSPSTKLRAFSDEIIVMLSLSFTWVQVEKKCHISGIELSAELRFG